MCIYIYIYIAIQELDEVYVLDVNMNLVLIN